ncbi:unnamed protein product [Caenorhabditis bovis]|uniref:VWFA domain-containing protein n=1 Tax=Caenorhabditis bovis TaxID=2654633 RepID=A0A8S1F8F1_9PELO|nr:unnamed protein product [Caenorhabditis bovis]
MPCCIVFILDTSGSMSTRSHSNITYFDLAKNYIETFIKGRAKNDIRFARDPAMGRDGDRYYLLTTTGNYPKNVKSFGERMTGSVLDEVKKIPYPSGAHNLPTAILDAFRLMHTYRTMTGIDGYGSGRAPGNTENVHIILLTDGTGVQTIPKDMKFQFDPPFLGSEMTREAFRWDQKFFCVVFRIPSTPYRPVPSQLLAIDIDIPNIERLCSATGGRSFSIVSVRQINTSIDIMFQAMNNHRIGVRFDCLSTSLTGKQSNEDLVKLRAKFKRVLEKRPVTNLISRITPQGRPVACHWQIPESFFPSKSMETLPPRLAHPLILLGTEAVPIAIRNDLPFDKLEVEPGGVLEIVMEMLAGRKDYAIPTFMQNSSNGGGNVPFGCLRLTTLGNGVNLILMPFNYPVFYQLVEELKDPMIFTNPQFRAKLDAYLMSIPFYCLTTVRQALEKFKVKVEVSSSMSNTYPPALLNYLNRLKMKGKEEIENYAVESKISEQRNLAFYNGMTRIERVTTRSGIIGLSKIDGIHEDDDDDSGPKYLEEFQIPLYFPDVEQAPKDMAFRTPWSSPIEDLTLKLTKMQANVDLMFDPNRITLLDMARPDAKPSFHILEEAHNLPLKIMGEYEPYQQARIRVYGAPFRKIEEEKERTHAFGNPYKLRSLGTVDEVSMDSSIVDNNKREGKRENDGGRMGGGPPKRKRGPLGLDAFEKWRIRRSAIGSDAGSTIADYSSDLETPTTSNGNAEVDDNDVDELTELMESQRKTEPEVNGKKLENGRVRGNSKNVLKELTGEEIMSKKLLIMSIVRRPANHQAFDEIVGILNGYSRESTDKLIRFATTESQRYKMKWLTEKLEKRLGTNL